MTGGKTKYSKGIEANKKYFLKGSILSLTLRQTNKTGQIN